MVSAQCFQLEGFEFSGWQFLPQQGMHMTGPLNPLLVEKENETETTSVGNLLQQGWVESQWEQV